MKDCPNNFISFDLLREECRECKSFEDCRNGTVGLENSTSINLAPNSTSLIDSTKPVYDIFTATYFIQQLMGAITKNAMMIGKILKPIKEGKLYQGYASHCETWGDYLKEIRISRSSADYLIKIWEVFGSLMGDSHILGIDHSRLIQALPFVKGPGDAEKWLNEAQTQTAEGFRNCLQVAKGKTPSDDGHEHEWINFVVCGICGKREKRD